MLLVTFFFLLSSPSSFNVSKPLDHSKMLYLGKNTSLTFKVVSLLSIYGTETDFLQQSVRWELWGAKNRKGELYSVSRWVECVC